MADEARVVVEQSTNARAEKKALNGMLARLDALLESGSQVPSKWTPLVDDCLAANGIAPGGDDQAVIFTEYADTADWLVDRVRSFGFTAERYSGRDPHPVRDDKRARFAQREFQLFISTDAGNEGIDLQTAHVLVNWDIPWSLVRLEQRMGRIHRVGQTRDVELYNLVATGTREGDVMKVLLDNFVTAANQLDGKMFDSLSLVAELAGVDVEGQLAATYAGDPEKAVSALAAARAVTAAQLEAAGARLQETSSKLASKVDVAAAVAALHEENLERINPAIVEAFLRKLQSCGAVGLAPDAAGDGIFAVTATSAMPLPSLFDGATAAVVATSGAALRQAREDGAVLHGAVSLGPAEPAFRDLVAAVASHALVDLFRGATLVDSRTATAYDLFAFVADAVEAGDRSAGTWTSLVRVDGAGARVVRWEQLANLSPADIQAPGGPHPERALAAENAAIEASNLQVSRRQSVMVDWLASATHELKKLPAALTDHIADADTRRDQRHRLRAVVDSHLADSSFAL